MIRADRPVVRTACVMLMSLAMTVTVAGCSHFSGVRWPWQHKPPPPPQEVHELVITADGGATAAFPQYWKRNTLLVDLQAASGSGSIVLKRREGASWPVRLAFRVRPGGIGFLEVRAEQRLLIPVNSGGTKPVDLELVPGVYTPKTAQLTVRWEPATAPAP